MAGGTWVTQNKVRPGAYINFEGVPTPISSVGSRGVMTMPLPMSWGPQGEVIRLYSTDLLDGKSLSKIGLTAFDKGSLIYREALSSAYLVLLYRLDAGGKKASLLLGSLAAAAKYEGATGNQIAVGISANGDMVDVVTYVAGGEKDKQTVPVTGEGLANNAWVNFALAEGDSLSELVATPLVGGEDGTVDPASYAGYFDAITQETWQVMAIPSTNELVKTMAVEYIRARRDNTGRKCQAVLVNQPNANHESVISVSQGYENTAREMITPDVFAVTVAGLTAASAINQSNTFKRLANAVSIIGPLADADVEGALKGGNFILTRRQDGGVVVEQDINTLHIFTPTKGYVFSKNRVVRVLDDVGNQVKIRFENAYIGQVDNSTQGRSVLRADITSYLVELQRMGAIQNFDAQTDVDVRAGGALDAVVVLLQIQPVDAMEKLYMTVLVGEDDR